MRGLLQKKMSEHNRMKQRRTRETDQDELPSRPASGVNYATEEEKWEIGVSTLGLIDKLDQPAPGGGEGDSTITRRRTTTYPRTLPPRHTLESIEQGFAQGLSGS